MITKVLFIVPHPDDELNIGGQLLYDLSKKGIQIYLIYTTNGDSDRNIGNKRISQAYSALKVLGVPQQNVFFMGYADGWADKQHIYNNPENKILESLSGKTHTNSLAEYDEYCYQIEGVHHSFTRLNFKTDLKNLIAMIKACLIVCVDFDKHPDHRAASLFFEEVMGELLKEDMSYAPIVLKKFAYDGVWTGARDYYTNPRIPTLYQKSYIYSNGAHELSSPCFSWNQRLRFSTNQSTKGNFLFLNPIFKAALKHISTNAFYCSLGIINDDIVFWWRPTENLMMKSEIQTSSGTSIFLNDFKLYDSSDILNINEPFKNPEYGAWVPDEDDLFPEINIRFEEEQIVKEIIIYECCDYINHVKLVEIVVDEKTIFKGELENSGLGKVIILEDSIRTKEISLKILDYEGVPMITEIEAYSKKQTFDWESFPIDRYSEQTQLSGRLNDKLLIYALCAIKYKLPYEVLRLMSRIKKWFKTLHHKCITI